MIDIHTHVIPNIDDGSPSLKVSIDMIRDAVAQGVTDIICTPHFDVDAIHYNPKIDLEKAFVELKKEVESANIKVNLYLGQELLYDETIHFLVRQQKVLPLNKSQYYLIEFSDNFVNVDLSELIYNLDILGFKLIIAHIERYIGISLKKIKEAKKLGALIQINVLTICQSNRKVTKNMLKLIKLGLVDFVSSDAHYYRPNKILEAYQIVSKKLGKEVADKVFINNAKKLLIR